MKNIANPWRGVGLPKNEKLAAGDVSVDDSLVLRLLGYCPAHGQTPLVDLPELAAQIGVARLQIKDERGRMGLGSFKALGAAYSIAKAAFGKVGDGIADRDVAATALRGDVFVTASAGNHGLSVAAGAKVFGAKAVIFLSETVPAGFADRLRDMGADVVVAGADYEQSMDAAQKAADENGWRLLSDSTWLGNTDGRDVMEGYLAMPAEIIAQYGTEAPSHVFLQAGVGGLAAGVIVALRKAWGDASQIVVVEPDAAPALQASIAAGGPVVAGGPVSNMGRLDCKEPSHLALSALAKHADSFLTLGDEYVADTIKMLEPFGLETSPSGGAGFAGAVALCDEIGADARVLVILSEGPADE